MGPFGAAVFLLAVGSVGGVATSAGAIATVISYPALLAIGIDPLAANVTNSVAVVGSGLGAAVGSRPELRGTGRLLVRWSLPICAGALAGAGLLLSTPRGLFVWVVPFLVASASLVMLAQPRISAWRAIRAMGEQRSLLSYGLFALGIYDGYFGAASGIMTLALLMLTVETHLTRANALKNVLLGVADTVAAIAFIVFGPVRWPAAIPLAVGFLAGGVIGPSVARRLPADVLRAAIAIAGLGLSVWLFVSALRG